MSVGRVLFSKFVVTDVTAALAFYEQAFGFVERNRIALPGMEEVLIGLPDDPFTLVLYYHTDGRMLSHGDHHGPLGLSMRDIQGAWDRAVAAGATPVRPLQDLPACVLPFSTTPKGIR